MKTAEEIQERIDHIKTLGKGLGINQKRINELEWVLNDKKAKKYRYIQAQTEWPKEICSFDDIEAEIKRIGIMNSYEKMQARTIGRFVLSKFTKK